MIPNPVVPDPGSKLSADANQIIDKAFERNQVSDLINIKKGKSESDEANANLFYFLGLSLSLLVCIVVINWKTYDQVDIVDLGVVQSDFDEMIEVPQSQQPPPPPPPKTITPIVVEVSDEVITEEINFEVDAEMTEDAAVEEHNIDFTMEDAAPEDEAPEEIFQIVETYPTPIGGMQGFYDFVSQNIDYPSQARRLDISGIVFVQFVVEKDGTLTDIKVIKGIGAGCDEEAVRVLEMAPNWNPGKQRGRNVRVYMTVPIRFILRK